jgi:hypothetical protein
LVRVVATAYTELSTEAKECVCLESYDDFA